MLRPPMKSMCVPWVAAPLLLLSVLVSHGHGVEYSCLGADNILDTIADIPSKECSQLCQDTMGCVLYTWLEQDTSTTLDSPTILNPITMANTSSDSVSLTPTFTSSSYSCLLYSHCELVFDGCPCSSCSCSTGLSPSDTTCFSSSLPELEGAWSCSSTPLSLSCSLECAPGYVPSPR